MTKTATIPKERKASGKQLAILAALGAATQAMTPSEVGVACGKEKGSPAADWAYPAIKAMVTKGTIIKAGPGHYQLGEKK